MRAARGVVARHRVASFVLLAYALSWAWWVPMAVRGDVSRTGVAWPTHLPGLAGPALAAVVVAAMADGRHGLADLWSGLTRWRVGARWWLLVAVTGLSALLALVVPAVSGGPVPDGAAFTRYSGLAEVGVAGLVVAVFVVNGVGEETGWRGLAADRLLREHGLARTALTVAVAWLGWHLPLFAVDDGFLAYGPLDAVGWALGLTAGSVVLTWMYRESGRSILLVAAWHTAFNVAVGTEGTAAIGAVVSTPVIVAALLVLRHERAAARSPGGGGLRGALR